MSRKLRCDRLHLLSVFPTSGVVVSLLTSLFFSLHELHSSYDVHGDYTFHTGMLLQSRGHAGKQTLGNGAG